MIEPKYKLGQRVYTKPGTVCNRPILETIYTISLDNNGDIIYNNYYNENDLFIATEWGDIRCEQIKCKDCPLQALNCYFIFDEKTIEQDKTLNEIYTRFLEKTGYNITKLKEKLLSPYE